MYCNKQHYHRCVECLAVSQGRQWPRSCWGILCSE